MTVFISEGTYEGGNWSQFETLLLANHLKIKQPLKNMNN